MGSAQFMHMFLASALLLSIISIVQVVCGEHGNHAIRYLLEETYLSYGLIRQDPRRPTSRVEEPGFSADVPCADALSLPCQRDSLP